MRFLSEIHVLLILQYVLLSFMWLYLLYVTLHFVSSSYLEYSVRWLEFMYLCAGYHFRYYMNFSAKVDIELILLMLCIDGLFLHLFCSTRINLNECDDMITLPLMNIMYMSLWYLCIVYDSMPNGYVIVSKYINLWMLF